MLGTTVNPIKLETGLRPNSAGIPYTLLLRIEAMGFPTFRLLLYAYLTCDSSTPKGRTLQAPKPQCGNLIKKPWA